MHTNSYPENKSIHFLKVAFHGRALLPWGKITSCFYGLHFERTYLSAQGVHFRGIHPGRNLHLKAWGETV